MTRIGEQFTMPTVMGTTLGARAEWRRIREPRCLTLQGRARPRPADPVEFQAYRYRRRWIAGIFDGLSFEVPDVGELKLRLRERLGNGQEWPELAGQVLLELSRADPRLVLVLDEFPMMVANMLDRDEGNALRFLKWFRTCRQSPGMESLRFLLGGSLNIEPRLERLGSEALLGDLQRFRISPLSQDDALTFLRQILDGEEYEWDGGVPEEILRVAQTGVHYYLQIIVQECLTIARQRRRPLQVEDIAPVYRDKVVGSENRHRFSHYHTRLKYYKSSEQAARVVLHRLCRSSELAIEEVRAVLSEAGERVAAEDILSRLEGDYYVVQIGDRVRFADGLLQAWWYRNGTTPVRAT